MSTEIGFTRVIKSIDPFVAELAARIAEVTDPLGSIKKASETIGIATNTLSRARRGENEPSPFVLVKIAKATNVSVEWLLGLSDDRLPRTVLGSPAHVLVPMCRAEAAAGAGADNGDVERGEPFPFPRAFIERRGGSPARVESLRAKGDSMEPTIASGALLILDVSRTEPPKPQPKTLKGPKKRAPPDGVYVFLQDGQLRLKRLRRMDAHGLTAIISDNIALHPPEFAQWSELKVLGEVIWWSNLL